MATKIVVGAVVGFTATFVDALGNAAAVDPTEPLDITFPSGTAEVVDSAVSADGMTATGHFKATAVGVGQIQIDPDADKEPGPDHVRRLLILGDFEAVAGDAVGGTITITP